MLASGNAAELGTALGNKLNPANAPLREYSRKLADTMAHACDELARTTETHMPKLNRSATAMAEDTMRRAYSVTHGTYARALSLNTQSGPNVSARRHGAVLCNQQTFSDD